MGSVGQRASKLLAVKVGGLKKKSAIWPQPLSNQSARVQLRPGSFSKFERQQLCRYLTYRLHIYSINRSKPFKKVCQISRFCCLLLGPLWQLKIPLVYFIKMAKRAVWIARHCTSCIKPLFLNNTCPYFFLVLCAQLREKMLKTLEK